MKHSARLAVAVLAANAISSVLAQTWCGKHFMPNQTVVPPGGEFQLPALSIDPLLAFRCSPAFRPYLEADAQQATFIVDTPIVYQYIQSASPISLPDLSAGGGPDTLDVTISIGNQVFAQGQVPLDATGYEIPVDLSALKVQKMAYNVTCSATYQANASSSSSPSQHFSTNTSLLYLPDTDSSVVKSDLRTGALWVRPANDTCGPFKPFVPQGFYISFDPALETNISYIEQLKADGFNTLHPIPPYNDTVLFEQVINKTIELGMYLIFDMRTIYQNLSAVTQQVRQYQSLPNLLLWETAHEPDGNSDPLTAAQSTYDLIYELDGYHPVSILLNCQDYNFAPYVGGADIVLEDAYPIGINATFSPVWHTPCTPDFGHCGCDNCEGSIYDIKERIQTFKERLNILGYDRSKTVWTVPQAFGSGAYWNTTPTGQQWATMGLTSFNHGATGSISFQYPTTTGNTTTIEGTAESLTGVIQDTIQPFIVDPNATYATYNVGGVDAGVWFNGTAYLILLANLNGSTEYVPWADVGLFTLTTNATTELQRVFSVSQNTNVTGFNFRPGGIGIYTATPPLNPYNH